MSAANRDLSHPAAAGAPVTRVAAGAGASPPPGGGSAGGDWLRTISQELGRIPLLMRHMRPTCELGGVDALHPELLRRLGVRGLIWDVDGTLMRRGDRSVAAGPHAALARLLAEPWLRHVILSNCGEARFRELAAVFPTIPLLRAYRAPDGSLHYRRRTGEGEWWRSGEGEWRPYGPGDALAGARALRKPSPDLVRLAVAELGLADPTRAAAIGDQRLTDVAGASLAGCLSIKVPTLGRESFPVPVRLLQLAEEAAYRVLYRERRSLEAA